MSGLICHPFEFDREKLATQFAVMLRMQDEMNTIVHPQWKTQNFAWHRAFWVEIGELVSHHGFKWWKKEAIDLPQVQLEIVDGFHFGISALLVETNSVEDAINHMIDQLEGFCFSGASILDAAEAVVLQVLTTKSLPVREFTELLYAADMNFHELYRQYVGKNQLNRLRQAHGYKDGTYVKVWNGREDNEHLTEIMDGLDTSSSTFADDVRAGLEARYPCAV